MSNTSKPILPHAGPMHWIDTATLSKDGRTTIATCRITPERPFVRAGTLQPAALIELLAQTAAAGQSLQAMRSGQPGGAHGVLAAIRNFIITGCATIGDTVILTATHEKTLGSLSLVSVAALAAERPVAIAHMTFHLASE